MVARSSAIKLLHFWVITAIPPMSIPKPNFPLDRHVKSAWSHYHYFNSALRFVLMRCFLDKNKNWNSFNFLLHCVFFLPQELQLLTRQSGSTVQTISQKALRTSCPENEKRLCKHWWQLLISATSALRGADTSFDWIRCPCQLIGKRQDSRKWFSSHVISRYYSFFDIRKVFIKRLFRKITRNPVWY